MSTVISSGFRYTGKGGLLGCYKELSTLRKPLEEMAVKKYNDFVANICVARIDRVVMKIPYKNYWLDDEDLDVRGNSPLSFAMSLWRKRHEKLELRPTNALSRSRWPLDHAVDVSCKVHLFPMSSQKIIGILLSANDFHDWFMDHPFIADYSYWNHSDKPREIPTREWTRRENDWRKAFPHTPEQTSMTMQLHSTYDPQILAMTSSDLKNGILAAIPSTAQRAKLLSREVIFERKIWTKPSEQEIHDGSKSSFHEWCSTEEGKKAIEEVETELALKLPKIDESIINNSAYMINE